MMPGVTGVVTFFAGGTVVCMDPPGASVPGASVPGMMDGEPGGLPGTFGDWA